MIRMSKLTDYGIVLLVQLAVLDRASGDRTDAGATHNARALAEETHLPLPVVSKLLKTLAREGVLASHRGAKGGYSLARRPETLSVAEIIRMLEGPIALTECGVHPGQCAQETSCSVRAPWQRINEVIAGALQDVTLAELLPGPGGANGGGRASLALVGRG
jgi:FeS assembly SUF system regulator